MGSAIARANPNIAFIKYWGNRNDQLRLPVNSSLSMNLSGLFTETKVSWGEYAKSDTLILNGQEATFDASKRVQDHLSAIRAYFKFDAFAQVESYNNFPTGAGIASSASAFAALTVAAVEAAGFEADERTLSILARLGSGSASRSIPSGFVEWHMGETHETSYAESFAEIGYWDLVDVIAVVSDNHKAVSSKAGHTSATTSDLQHARVVGAQQRFKISKQAILSRDFSTFAKVTELDSNLMHAVMMTSDPPLFYWLPESLLIMQRVREWRRDGLDVCYTLDAGPNVHCICTSACVNDVKQLLTSLSGVKQVLTAFPGQGAHLITH